MKLLPSCDGGYFDILAFPAVGYVQQVAPLISPVKHELSEIVEN